ncbi:MAG: bifunctional nuclease family protein [Chloroflexi bacterium]|nr:bifunctional nuclease family protein [Chloroflexota bacterium]
MDADWLEVTIDSVRVSLVSPHRIVVLKDKLERFLPIWIGPFESDAITIALQGNQVARPLTHDLLKSVITETGAVPAYVVVRELRDETFFASIFMKVDGKTVEIDARPSDAIALAVRVQVPVYVKEMVMERASIRPSQAADGVSREEAEKLEPFRDLLEDLDLDDLGKGEEKTKDN